MHTFNLDDEQQWVSDRHTDHVLHIETAVISPRLVGSSVKSVRTIAISLP